MATYIKTLKEDNGDVTYPQTKAGAVYTNEGSDVQTVLDDCTRFEEVSATSPLTPLVTGGMIDWSTMYVAKREWTGSLELPTTYSQIYELDVSSFPTGSVMMFIGSMQCNGTSTLIGSYCRGVHGTVNGPISGTVTSWGRNVTCVGMFTKIAGETYIKLYASKDNSTTCTATVLSLYAWRVG